MDDTGSSWLSRLRSLRGVWRDIAQAFGGQPKLNPDLAGDDADQLLLRMRQCL